MNGTVLEVLGLSKRFGTHVVLSDVSFTLGQKEILGIIGPSGGGKTTLLRCLNFLEVPDGGRVEYPGVMEWDARREGGAEDKDMVNLRRHVGMVFQGFNLWESRTVVENLTLAPVVVRGMTAKAAQELARDLCRQFGLEDKLLRSAVTLSGGEKQRVAIIRALMMQPFVMLLDEITSALDPVLTVEVMGAIRKLRERGLAMIIVTHHLDFASSLCDRLMFLHEGRILQLGPPISLQEEPASPKVRQFVEVLRRAR